MQVGGILTEKNLLNVPGVLRRQKKYPKILGGGPNFFFPLLNFFFFKNVPGVLKRMQKKIIFRRGGGGFWGVWGAPHRHPGVARGQKTIHFFL